MVQEVYGYILKKAIALLHSDTSSEPKLALLLFLCRGIYFQGQHDQNRYQKKSVLKAWLDNSFGLLQDQ